MAMYECAHCGSEEGAFPKVFLSINDIPEYPDNPHENKFEQKYDQIYSDNHLKVYDSSGRPINDNITKAWDLFWSWLGDTETKWFCSVECAVMYLRENGERKEKIS